MVYLKSPKGRKLINLDYNIFMDKGNKQINQLKDDLVLFRYVVLAFVAVVLGSTIFFHFAEKWNWLNSVYFVVVTISTVGYGNIVPHNAAGKVGAMILIIVGIGIFGVFVNQLLKRQGLRRLERVQDRKTSKK